MFLFFSLVKNMESDLMKKDFKIKDKAVYKELIENNVLDCVEMYKCSWFNELLDIVVSETVEFVRLTFDDATINLVCNYAKKKAILMTCGDDNFINTRLVKLKNTEIFLQNLQREPDDNFL